MTTTILSMDESEHPRQKITEEERAHILYTNDVKHIHLGLYEEGIK